MKANCWIGKKKVRVEKVPDPKILNAQRRHRAHHLDRHLRLGPAPLQRLRPDHGEGRHPRPRVHGRGRRGRAAASRTSRSATAWWCPSPSPAALRDVPAAAVLGLRELQPERLDGGEAVGPLAGRASSATRTCSGGFAGGQAEYARVPFADVGPLKVPDGLTDEQVLFLSDIFPTGYMGAEMCDIKPGDVIAVWGAGPVGQFAIASARLLGAERVIAIDRFPYRLQMAQRARPAPPTPSTTRKTTSRGAARADRRARPRRLHRRGRAWRRTGTARCTPTTAPSRR